MAKVQEGVVYGGYRNVALCVFHGEWFPFNGSCKRCDAEVKLGAKAAPEDHPDWQDEPTQPSGDPDCATCGTPKSFHQVFTNTNDKTAWCRGGRYEGHSYSPAQPASEATLPTCSSNGSFSAGDVFDVGASKDAVIALYFPKPGEPAPSHGDVVGPRQWHIVMDGGHCGDADCERCDPLDRMVDGLTVRECLARYEAYQRGDSGGGYAFRIGPNSRETLRPWSLTETQMAAAKQAWSLELKRKQAEAREKERAQVVCERDEDGE